VGAACEQIGAGPGYLLAKLGKRRCRLRGKRNGVAAWSPIAEHVPVVGAFRMAEGGDDVHACLVSVEIEPDTVRTNRACTPVGESRLEVVMHRLSVLSYGCDRWIAGVCGRENAQVSSATLLAFDFIWLAVMVDPNTRVAQVGGDFDNVGDLEEGRDPESGFGPRFFGLLSDERDGCVSIDLGNVDVRGPVDYDDFVFPLAAIGEGEGAESEVELVGLVVLSQSDFRDRDNSAAEQMVVVL